jgi:YVTN family beta-propeller protein
MIKNVIIEIQFNSMRFYKKTIYLHKILIISILTIETIFVSCKKKDITTPEPVVIDYPKAYVVNGGSNTISILNLQDLIEKQIIQLTDVGRFPHHINLSPDGKKLAVAIPEFDFTLGHAFLHNATDKKGGIAVIDAQTGTTLLKIGLPNANFNAAFSLDGTEIWSATSTHSGEMYVFDANTGVQKAKIALGSDPSEVTFSKDGQYAFIALGESSFVYVLKTSTKEIIKTIKVDPYPTNVWAGNDGKMYVENKVAHSINIIDAKTLTAIEFIDVNFTPGQTSYNQVLNELWICQAGENKVAYFERKNNIWSLKGNIQTGDDAHAVTFSKDDKKAYIVNQKGNSVSVIDVSTHTKTKDIMVGSMPNGIVLRE